MLTEDVVDDMLDLVTDACIGVLMGLTDADTSRVCSIESLVASRAAEVIESAFGRASDLASVPD